MFLSLSSLAMYLPFTLLSLLIVNTNAQSATSRAEMALSALQIFYNQSTGLWNTCGWWNGANCMTVIADLAALDSNVAAMADRVFSNTYVNAPGSNPDPGVEKKMVNGEPVTFYAPPAANRSKVHTVGKVGAVNASAWLDGFYDDDAWWGLGWVAAYDVTKNQDYLQTAMGIFDAMTAGWPTNCNNGGIWWSTDQDYANAIANELFLSLAAHLANRVPSNKTYYVDWAQREWNWFQASGMINSDNLINDGLTDDCQNNGETTWTYNQGVVLGGLVELNKAAPNSSYLSVAGKIAHAAIGALTDDEGVLHESCEPECGGDGTQFKGIFMRNLQLLQSAAPSDDYVRVINASANSIWANDRNQGNMFSVDWSGPFVDPVNASTHSSAMDAIVAAITVQ